MNEEPSLTQMFKVVVELELRSMLDDPERLRELLIHTYASKPASDVRRIYYDLHPDYGENDASQH